MRKGVSSCILPLMRRLLSALALLLFSALPARAAEFAPASFLSEVRPLLDRSCIKCHGSEKQKGGLRLDSREAALKGGESGPALVPGKPGESLMLRLVRHAEADREMPPKEKLKPRDVALLERWILAGAPWAEQPIAAAVASAPGEKIGDAWTDPRNPIVRIFGGQRLDLWSLRPIQKVSPPAVRDTDWIRTPIDRFVLAKFETRGVRPPEEADRRTVARRLFFDLTGLPPQPAELAEFIADASPDAYERLVERLLASREYGEHWARLWLDVVRYSDSNGFDWDEFRPNAWRFRDYVIRSLNADKPFDRFVREQLAGDELVSGPPRDTGEQDALIATGFLRLGPHDNSAGAFGEANRVRAQLLADLVETTGSAFLGLTMSCCRCHDHKYDPISQADHYRMRAFFEGVKFRDDLPLDLAAEQEAIRKHNAELDPQVSEARKARDAIAAPVKARLRAKRVAELSPEERLLLASDQSKRDEAAKKKVDALERKIDPPEKEVLAALGDDEKRRYAEADAALQAIRDKRRAFTTGMLMTEDEAKPPPPTHVLFQGDLNQPKEAVPPGYLSALDPNPAELGKPSRKESTGRRSALADWIVSERNPLTARVLVNRVWQAYFGEGIVATPNDFGLAGARPIEPELLDWLAGEFMRSGWSLKALHRVIVRSASYRQRLGASEEPRSSAQEPLLVRSAPRRISAEALRDAALAASGQLLPCDGGAPVWPELPQDVLQANPALLDDNKEKTKGWYPSPAEKTRVRSVYLVQKRTVRVPLLEIFDLPENSVSCARRNVSTVAPQALTLLNSPFATRAAAAFAERLKHEAGEDSAAQIDRAFTVALQRSPDDSERAACRQFRERHSLAELCRALLNLNEFVYVD